MSTDNEQLRAEIAKLIAIFGLQAGLWGVTRKNPKPDDPTDEIMALFHQALEAREAESRITTLEELSNIENIHQSSYIINALSQSKAQLADLQQSSKDGVSSSGGGA